MAMGDPITRTSKRSSQGVFSHRCLRKASSADTVIIGLGGSAGIAEAPPGSLTLLIQRAPYMPKRCAHVVFHDQLINDFAIQIDFGEFAALFGAQLIDMEEAFHSFNS